MCCVYLIVSETNKNKDEHSLEAVEEREDVSENDRFNVSEIQESKYPRNAHNKRQANGTRDPCFEIFPCVEVTSVKSRLESVVLTHVIHRHRQKSNIDLQTNNYYYLLKRKGSREKVG